MAQIFDLVVLGVGMAAVSAAQKCASAGWSVAVVDELPYGGTCALRGCDPKKILRRGAEIIDAARLMHGKGVEGGGLRINWSELVAFKRSFTDKMPDRIESSLGNNGVATFHGTAEFVNENTIEVGGETQLQGRRVLIATGAKPQPLDVPGAQYLTDSTDFMELDALPKRILFVGGGYVSFEFAHIAARAGSTVMIIDRGERPLKTFDQVLVDKLVARGRTMGIAVRTETALTAIQKTSSGFAVNVEAGDETDVFSADLVVHGAGRIPAVEQLDLAAAGIDATDAGISVNNHLQSVSNAAVYAAGDAADTEGAPLTPVAVFEGKVAASNMLKGNHVTPEYRGVPSVVFTIPELARVGILETEARETARNVRVAFNDTGGWYSNLRVGETCAASKVIIDPDTEEILGAHLLGPESAELINFFALAIKPGLKISDLKQMTAAYPSAGSDLGSML